MSQQKYLHLKTGKVYEIITVARCSETLEERVIYGATGEGGSTGIWSRPKAMFFDGRFERVER